MNCSSGYLDRILVQAESMGSGTRGIRQTNWLHGKNTELVVGVVCINSALFPGSQSLDCSSASSVAAMEEHAR